MSIIGSNQDGEGLHGAMACENVPARGPGPRGGAIDAVAIFEVASPGDHFTATALENGWAVERPRDRHRRYLEALPGPSPFVA